MITPITVPTSADPPVLNVAQQLRRFYEEMTSPTNLVILLNSTVKKKNTTWPSGVTLPPLPPNDSQTYQLQCTNGKVSWALGGTAYGYWASGYWGIV